MSMFSDEEKKNLKQLLACAVDQEEALSIEGLHGYLNGLAIIPESIMPSEWLPGIFGEEMLDFGDQNEAQRRLAVLFSVYNRIMQDHREGKLVFPFDYEALSQSDIRQMREWAEGFFLATSLRPEIWGIDEDGKDDAVMPESPGKEDEEDDVAASFSVVMGVAFPHRIPELLNHADGRPHALNDKNSGIEAKLFSLLPHAVETIRRHAETWKGSVEGRAGTFPSPMQPRRVEKIGRNDPCHCGSGVKYKKCCGK